MPLEQVVDNKAYCRTQLSNWFVVTLSAEQAALDGDFEHFDALILRREALLDGWEAEAFVLSPDELAEINSVEARLRTTLERINFRTGGEIRSIEHARKSVSKYKSA
jgi:hypothetical protein